MAEIINGFLFSFSGFQYYCSVEKEKNDNKNNVIFFWIWELSILYFWINKKERHGIIESIKFWESTEGIISINIYFMSEKTDGGLFWSLESTNSISWSLILDAWERDSSNYFGTLGTFLRILEKGTGLKLLYEMKNLMGGKSFNNYCFDSTIHE